LAGRRRRWRKAARCEHDAAGADLGVLADLDIAKHLGAAERRTPSRTFGWRSPRSLPVPPSVTSWRIETVVADDRGLADDDAGAVIDEDAGADRHGGVDVDGETSETRLCRKAAMSRPSSL